MSDSEDDAIDDDEYFRITKGYLEDEGDGSGETLTPEKSYNGPLPTSESEETKEKKGKSLRFSIPEKIDIFEESQKDESRQPSSLELENINGARSSFLSIPQTHNVVDVVRILKNFTEEYEYENSSVYLDTENRVFRPTNFPFKSLSDVKRPSSMKQADYHLLLSARFRSVEGVMEALKQGANVNVIQGCHCPIIIATENNDKPMVNYLVRIKNINLNVQNLFGHCPLSIALKNGYDEIAILLLKNNARMDIVDNLGRTPLHEAVLQENYNMVEFLIRYGTELETVDHFGEKAIYACSVKKPNLTILNLLLQSGASCEYENITGLSLLSRAIHQTTNFDVIKKLVESGANVNHQDSFCKRTPLHMAAIIDNVKVAKFLIEYGANPDLRTIAGYTAFDLALYYKCYDAAKYLHIHTKNPALNAENFKDSLLSRIPNQGSGLLVLLLKTHASSKGFKV